MIHIHSQRRKPVYITFQSKRSKRRHCVFQAQVWALRCEKCASLLHIKDVPQQAARLFVRYQITFLWWARNEITPTVAHKSEILCRENIGWCNICQTQRSIPIACHGVCWLRHTHWMCVWFMSYQPHGMANELISCSRYVNGSFGTILDEWWLRCWFKVSSTYMDLKSHNPFLSKHLCQRTESRRFKSHQPNKPLFSLKKGLSWVSLNGLPLSLPIASWMTGYVEHTYNSKSDPWAGTWWAITYLHIETWNYRCVQLSSKYMISRSLSFLGKSKLQVATHWADFLTSLPSQDD